MLFKQIILLSVVMASLAGPAVAAAAAEDDTEVKIARIKAAYVLNFLKYAQWPKGSFPEDDATSPIVMTVVGEDPLIRRMLSQSLENARIGDRTVKVSYDSLPTLSSSADAEARKAYERQIEELATTLRRSHAVFVCQQESSAAGPLLKAIADAPILTLSDEENFAEQGGMLALTIRDNRVVFDANPAVIRRAGLQISAQVLRLARIVETGGERGK